MSTTPITDAIIRGAAELEVTQRGIRPHRLPAHVRGRDADARLLAMEAQPSGVRIVAQTDATEVTLVLHSSRVEFTGVSRPRGAVDLVIGGDIIATDRLTGGDAHQLDLATGVSEIVPGASHTSHFSGMPRGAKTVELWLPHNESVELIELRSDAPLAPTPQPKPLWLHHGSSISQGSNATSPARTWPGIVAREVGVELRNLGFGGSALVDPFMARVIRDAPADLISLAFGVNVVNLDGMRLRTFVPAVHGFLDTVRDGHPDTPLLLVSPIFCGIHEDTPGPGMVDPASLVTDQVRFVATGGDTSLGRLTLTVVRDALAQIVEQRDDAALHYLDGTTLYGADDAVDLPLPDNLHPDTATHALIAERVVAQVFSPGGPLATA